jgi:hypothetical protein
LNIHQSRSTNHDRLGFHPDCAVCRQDRLFAVLSPHPVVARRVRVLLATGVLAFSAGLTATSVASEPDDQQEGVVAPEGGSAVPGDSPGPGPGGETSLPYEVDPVPDGSEQSPPEEGSDEAAPLEAEPVDDPDGRLPLSDPAPPDDLNSEQTPVPPTEVAPPVIPAPPAAPPIPPDADSGLVADPPPTPARERSSRPTKRPGQRRAHAKRRAALETTPVEPVPADPVPADPVPADSAAAVAAVEAAGAAAAVATVSADLRGRRFHVVRPGESLWSIASALLEPGASASSIAHQVRRLWRLNADRIGTGDPNLLAIGVRLRLR